MLLCKKLTILLFTSSILLHTVFGVASSDCHRVSGEEVCFNGLSRLDVQVMENRGRVIAASLGSTTCNPTQLNYDVMVTSSSSTPESKDVFGIEKSKNESTTTAFDLWIRQDLDRENISSYNFTLICVVRLKNENSEKKFSIPGLLTVLDEDDNPPITFMGSSQATVYISLHPDKNKLTPGSRLKPDGKNYTELTFEDKDSLDVNNFTIVKVNDTKNLLEIKWIHHQLNHRGVPSTFGILRAFLGETRIGSWEGLYCVIVIVNDTSLKVESGDPKVTFNICLHLGTKPVQSHLLKKGIVEERESTCGKMCISLLVIIAACLFLFGTSAFIMYVWKRRVNRKSRPVRACPVIMNNSGVHVSNGFVHVGEMSEYHTGHTALTYDYMPADPKWELPRTSITIQEFLGRGEFGIVHRAKFRDADPQGKSVDVAVKILKENHTMNGKSSRQEFMAEFSLLKQVDHLNVIKLIGACTTGEGPFYLIMEYCKYKSLKTFLLSCRNVEKNEGRRLGPSIGMMDVPNSRPNSSADETVRELYPTVTAQEILGFCWQIAKGMTYLSEMKMVHRDLAARNILLTWDRICKISDFGLTRDVYVDEAYKKQSTDKVPVKWLAMECLREEVYTTKSDVWAFGILMWELVNFGATPYPGVPTEQLYFLLRSNYRMPKPENCSDELYDIMRCCWEYEPNDRPTFRTLVDALGKLLEAGEDYLQINFNMVSNPGYGFNPPTFSRDFSPTILPSNSESSETQVLDGLMENARLIENEISTCGGETGLGASFPSNTLVHTYINHPRRNLVVEKVPSENVTFPLPPSSSSTTTTTSPSAAYYESPIKKKPDS